MAFAAARMILKDKRRKPSKEEYVPIRNRSKVKGCLLTILLLYEACAMVVAFIGANKKNNIFYIQIYLQKKYVPLD